MANTIDIKVEVKSYDALNPAGASSPLENVTCKLTRSSITPYTDTKYTDSAGIAQFNGIPWGTPQYTIIFTKPGYKSASIVVFGSQSGFYKVRMTTDNYVIANLRVKDLATNVGLSSVQVSAVTGTDPPVVGTTIAGLVSLTLKQNKTYRVTFTKTGYSSVASNVTTTTTTVSPTTFLMSQN